MAVELDSDYALAWSALGRELAASNVTLPEAVTALRRALHLNGADRWSMVFLANALARSGDVSEADSWHRRAIAAFPHDEDMKRWYAQFLAGAV